MVEQLLAAGAVVDAKDEVRGELGRIGEGWLAERISVCPLDFIVLCFSHFGVTLASRIIQGIGHVTTV